MSDEVKPLVNLNNISMVGMPHHGLVEGGTLTKADLSTMDYPQPMNGDTNIIKFADTPAIVRTTEQQESDTAAHYEWRDYALAGGEQLGGKLFGLSSINKSLSGTGLTWGYLDSENVLWICTLSLVSWVVGVASLRVDYEPSGGGTTGFNTFSIRTGLTVPVVQLDIFNKSSYGDKIIVLIADASTIGEATEYRWIEVASFGEEYSGESIGGAWVGGVLADAALSAGPIWLYRDANKSVWMCELYVTAWAAGVATIDVDFIRFGYVAHDSQYQYSSVSFDITTDLSDAFIDLEVVDISPDGTKAIVCLSSGANANWVEVVLSGVIDLTALTGLIVTPTIIKDKAACWSSSSETVFGNIGYQGALVQTLSRSGDTWPAWNETDAAAPKTQIDTNSYSFDVIPFFQERDELIEFSQVIWAFYDKANIIHFVSTRCMFNEVFTPSATWGGGGTLTLTQISKVFVAGSDTPGGFAPRTSAVVSGSADLGYTTKKKWERTATYELLVDDASVSAVVISDIREHEIIHVDLVDGSDYDTSGTAYDGSSPVLGGGVSSHSTTDSTTVTDWNADEWVFTYPAVGSAPNLYTYRQMIQLVVDKPTERGERFHFAALFYSPDDTGMDNIRAVKLSNKLICLKIESVAKDRVYYREIAHPEGVDATLFDSAYGAAPEENSSYQPETGDITRNKASEVCYI